MSGEIKRLLFVCVENSNRSQMAEAFARIHGGDAVVAYSAGSRPSGVVNPKAVASMRELDYDLSAHGSKSLDEIPDVEYDFVATMGCGDACPIYPGKKYLDWELEDPANKPIDQVRPIREEIDRRVRALLEELTPATS
mgnify:CR=1 FL=1